MKALRYTLIILLFTASNSFSQTGYQAGKRSEVNMLLDSLWQNPTSFFNNTDPNWRMLCNDLQNIDLNKLNQIKDSIFSVSKDRIKNESASSVGLLGYLNKKSRDKRAEEFTKRIDNGFRDKAAYPNNKVVLVEGDSWFEYPLFLDDITDDLMKEDNLAVYSLASGGDWAANMISSAEYQNEYLQLKPDIFIISGGGNDIVGDQGITNFVSKHPIDKHNSFLKDYREYVVLRQNKQPVPLCNAGFCPIEYHLFTDSMDSFISHIDTANLNKIVNGRRYINKNFYRWLVTFKLEYKLLFASLRQLDSVHFNKLKIITQGYDYAIPSTEKKFGIRLLMENGQYLKKPMEKIGINDQYTQESIIMAMMFDFNEMLIELGKEYQNIYHVDVRGFTSYLEHHDGVKNNSYWFDELHPTDPVFAEIAKVYVTIINNNTPKNQRVFKVVRFFMNTH